MPSTATDQVAWQRSVSSTQRGDVTEEGLVQGPVGGEPLGGLRVDEDGQGDVAAGAAGGGGAGIDELDQRPGLAVSRRACNVRSRCRRSS